MRGRRVLPCAEFYRPCRVVVTTTESVDARCIALRCGSNLPLRPRATWGFFIGEHSVKAVGIVLTARVPVRHRLAGEKTKPQR